jgi:hypothetical protein
MAGRRKTGVRRKMRPLSIVPEHYPRYYVKWTA